MHTLTESRLYRLEAIEAIKQLKAKYCYFADSKEFAREFADLFLSDAILDEGEDFMVLNGKSEIYRMHQAIWKHIKLNQHLVMSPNIEINGNRATGQWRLLQLIHTADVHSDNSAFWACGWYDEEYQLTDAGWKFKHVIARVHFCTAYENGWGKSLFDEVLSEQSANEIINFSKGVNNEL